MFCENCGTRVDDGAPFCPNCGSKMPVPEAPAAPEAPVTPAPEAAPAPDFVPPAAPAKAPAVKGLFGKLNAMSVMEKIFFLCTCGLLVTCVFVSLFRVFYSPYYGSFSHMETGSVFFTRIITVLFTLSITFLVLDYLDKFSFKWLWFFIAGAAATIFLLFIIIWIASRRMLSFGGWIFLLLVSSLVAASVLLLLEKLKKK